MTGAPRERALRMIAAPFITAKAICLLLPVLVVWSSSNAPGFPGTDELRTAFNQWDSQSYVHIAALGYPATTTNPGTVYLAGFFPGFPILLRLGSVLTGDAVIAGLIISAIAEWVALYYIARLVMAERDAGSARFVVWLFALWPFAFFLSAVYTESTFIACAAASLYHGRQGRMPRASLAALLACSVRLTGVALIPALAWEIFSRSRFRPTRDWLALAVVPAPLLAFGLYMQIHAHDFFAYLTAQSSKSFNHHLVAPWVGFFATYHQLDPGVTAHDTYVFGVEVFFGALGAALCVLLWCRPDLPRSLAIYCTAVFLIATSISIWLSVPRYELAMFPALIVLSDVTRRRLELRAAMAGMSCALMAFGTTLYARGNWLG